MPKIEDTIKELSPYPGFNIQLNLEALLTLHVETQHAVTHFKRDTFSLSGKSVRQRNVRRDNTKDKAGTLPSNLCKSETILNPMNLQLVTTAGQSDIIESLDNEVREEHTEQPEPIDTYCK